MALLVTGAPAEGARAEASLTEASAASNGTGVAEVEGARRLLPAPSLALGTSNASQGELEFAARRFQRIKRFFGWLLPRGDRSVATASSGNHGTLMRCQSVADAQEVIDSLYDLWVLYQDPRELLLQHAGAHLCIADNTTGTEAAEALRVAGRSYDAAGEYGWQAMVPFVLSPSGDDWAWNWNLCMLYRSVASRLEQLPRMSLQLAECATPEVHTDYGTGAWERPAWPMSDGMKVNLLPPRNGDSSPPGGDGIADEGRAGGVAAFSERSPTWAEAAEARRIAGDNRFETAALVATETFGVEGATDVVLASGMDFPDALAGSPLAGTLDAPILLTAKDHLPTATRRALMELEPQVLHRDHQGSERDQPEPRTVHILGSEAAVSAAVAHEVAALGFAVRRIGGPSRFDTAADIARAVFDAAGTPVVLLATGHNFADALAAAPFAYEAGMPMLLTDTRVLPRTTLDALAHIRPELVVVLGGVTAVHESVETSLAAAGYATQRVAGSNRFQTSTELAEIFHEEGGPRAVTIARADGFADALTVASRAYFAEAALVLSPPRSPSADVQSYLTRHAGTLKTLHAVGGETAISESVLQQYVRAASS